MSGVRKKPHPKTERRNVLLEIILSHPVRMKDCTYCSNKKKRNFSECQLSEEDSTRCTECVKDNKSLCDARPLSSAQLRKIAMFHTQYETALEEAEKERKTVDAKIERLRKQKRLWLEKMTRAVARGIDDLEELDRVEREEAEASGQTATLPNPTDPVISDSAIGSVDWDAFDPSLLDLNFGEGRQEGPLSASGTQ